jgi:hypothetical protein
MCRWLRIARTDRERNIIIARSCVAGIVVAIGRGMPAFAYSDETIRVPRLELHVAPRRPLPTQFAPTKRQRLPLLALAALVATVVLAAWKPIVLPDQPPPSVHAQELLKLLRG